jgi:hypothetical protein
MDQAPLVGSHGGQSFAPLRGVGGEGRYLTLNTRHPFWVVLGCLQCTGPGGTV